MKYLKTFESNESNKIDSDYIDDIFADLKESFKIACFNIEGDNIKEYEYSLENK